MLDDVLARGAVDAGVPVVMISGNHDSAQRLGFGARLLAAQGLHVAGRTEREATSRDLVRPGRRSEDLCLALCRARCGARCLRRGPARPRGGARGAPGSDPREPSGARAFGGGGACLRDRRRGQRIGAAAFGGRQRRRCRWRVRRLRPGRARPSAPAADLWPAHSLRRLAAGNIRCPKSRTPSPSR
ncbi:hypothetical protein ACU4GD_04075 [Cupriavidus basilensis]